MINQSKKQKETEQKQKIHRRVYTKIDPENYEFIPAKKQIDYYDNDIPQRVAVYARVSTDNIQQTFLIRASKEVLRGVCHSPSQLDSGENLCR